MSDMKMYNILGVMKGLNDNAKSEQLNESVKQPTVYENVEPKGSIMDAVKSLAGKFAKFNESAKPDFLDVDKDGNKKEPFKKAVKDKKEVDEGTIAKPKKDLRKHSATAKRMAMQKKADKGHEEWLDHLEKTDPDHPSLKYRKQATNEGAGPYTLDDPKHPKFKANYEKYKKAHPDCTLAEFVAAMRKKEKGLAEAAYDEPAAPDAAAIAKRKRLQALKDKAEDEGDIFAKEKNTPIRKVAGKAYGGAAQKDDAEKDDLDEVAPPGAKAERMVKHIKKGYAKDGKLTKREKGIAYATAWKAKKAGVVEATQFGDKIANSKAELKKAKPAMVKESRVMEETDYFYEKVAKSLCDKNPNLDTASSDFVGAVRKEMIAQGIEPNRARNILLMDEDFIMDVASSYGHYCKELAECGSPVNSFVEEAPMEDTMQELDEIAKLAGLTTELDERETFQSMPKDYASGTPAAPTAPTTKPTYDKSKLNPMREEEVEEGNEFSGALAKAKASGAKEFEVDGKKYTVKEAQEQVNEEVTNLSIQADGVDAVRILQKLSGLAANDEAQQPAEPQAGQVVAQPAEPVEVEVDEERDVEYTNTPNEKIASVDAVIPSGNDMHRAKKSYSDKPYQGDNPMAVKEEALWKSYEAMIKDVKK